LSQLDARCQRLVSLSGARYGSGCHLDERPARRSDRAVRDWPAHRGIGLATRFLGSRAGGRGLVSGLSRLVPELSRRKALLQRGRARPDPGRLLWLEAGRRDLPRLAAVAQTRRQRYALGAVCGSGLRQLRLVLLPNLAATIPGPGTPHQLRPIGNPDRLAVPLWSGRLASGRPAVGSVGAGDRQPTL